MIEDCQMNYQPWTISHMSIDDSPRILGAGASRFTPNTRGRALRFSPNQFNKSNLCLPSQVKGIFTKTPDLPTLVVPFTRMVTSLFNRTVRAFLKTPRISTCMLEGSTNSDCLGTRINVSSWYRPRYWSFIQTSQSTFLISTLKRLGLKYTKSSLILDLSNPSLSTSIFRTSRYSNDLGAVQARVEQRPISRVIRVVQFMHQRNRFVRKSRSRQQNLTIPLR